MACGAAAPSASVGSCSSCAGTLRRWPRAESRGSNSGGRLLGGRGAGQGPLTADAATFTLAHTTPNTELFPITQGIFEAFVAHDAATAHLFCLARGRAPLGEEQVGIDAETIGRRLPRLIVGTFGDMTEHHRGIHLLPTPESERATRHLALVKSRSGK